MPGIYTPTADSDQPHNSKNVKGIYLLFLHLVFIVSTCV